MTAVSLYDVMNCPTCYRCEACGTADGLLAPWAVRINHGVMCLTLCPRCLQRVTRDVAIPVADDTAKKFVDQHCEHLKIRRHSMDLMLAEEDRQTREAAARLVESGALAPDPDFLRAVTGATMVDELTRTSVNGHGIRLPGHEHVHCSVCGDDMVHVDVRPRDGARIYAAHPSIPGEPDSVHCSNTDHVVGTHRGGPIPSPTRRRS
jgi:hypothetical protein